MADRSLNEAEEAIGYVFKDKTLLETAFVHSSYSNETGIPSNENLEFLGDSVLGLVVSEYLYRLFGSDNRNHSEGKLTEIRRAVVSMEPLNAAADGLGLERFALFGRGEAGSDHRAGKTLCNLYEAVAGAIYMDGGIRAAESFILKTLKDVINGAVRSGGGQSSKNILQEYVQKHSGCLPLYKTERNGAEINEFVSRVYVDGVCLGIGIGNRKKTAELSAADDALSKIFKQKY